jgi:hypothetical protein
MEREYYSQRMGFTKTARIDLSGLKKIFKVIYSMFFNKDFFMEKIGCYAPSSGNYYTGELGTDEDINSYIYLKLRKEHLWPIYQYLENYSEADLFDIIEFCFDVVSKPVYTNRFPHTGKVTYNTNHAMTRIIKQHEKTSIKKENVGEQP